MRGIEIEVRKPASGRPQFVVHWGLLTHGFSFDPADPVAFADQLEWLAKRMRDMARPAPLSICCERSLGAGS